MLPLIIAGEAIAGEAIAGEAIAGEAIAGEAIAGEAMTAGRVAKATLKGAKKVRSVHGNARKRRSRGNTKNKNDLMRVEIDDSELNQLIEHISKIQQYVNSINGNKYITTSNNLKRTKLRKTKNEAQFAIDNKKVMEVVDDVAQNIDRILV